MGFVVQGFDRSHIIVNVHINIISTASDTLKRTSLFLCDITLSEENESRTNDRGSGEPVKCV